jgi:hypothetical protein
VFASKLQQNAKVAAEDARAAIAQLDDRVRAVKAQAADAGEDVVTIAKAQNRASGSGLAAQLDDISERARNYSPDFKGIAEEVQAYKKTLLDMDVSPGSLARYAEDKAFQAKALADGPKGEIWREVRDAVQAEAGRQFDTLAASVDPALVGKYTAAIDQTMAARWVEQVAASGKARNWLDEGLTAAGEAAKGGGLTGLAIAGAQAVRRQSGPLEAKLARWAANVIDPQTAVVQGLARQSAAATSRVQASSSRFLGWLARGAAPKAYIEASTPKTKQHTQQETRELARRIADAVKAAKANPTSVLDAVSRDAGALALYAPKTYGSVVMKYDTALNHLAGLLPPQRPRHLLSHLDKQPMDDVSAERLVRAAGAIADPMAVLDRLERGTVNRDELDAIRAVAPNMFAEMQNSIMVGLATREINPDYRGRLTLSMAFNIPADSSMLPASVAMSQTVYAKDGVDSGADGRGVSVPRNVPKRPIEGYSSAMRTREQRREERDPGGRI